MKLQLTKAFSVNGHKIKITIEHHGSTEHLWIAATVDNGFNLCDIHHGYLKGRQPRNTRLRSEKSKLKEMEGIYQGYRAYIEQNLERWILDRATITVDIRGQIAIPKGQRLGDLIDTVNIRSKQSGLPVAWHYHNIYRRATIEVEAVRCPKSGQLQFFADERELYDQEKLKALVESENFKERRLAFFFYNEALRLTGHKIEGSPKMMSGLFAA